MSAEDAVHVALKDHSNNIPALRQALGAIVEKHGKDALLEALIHCSAIAYTRLNCMGAWAGRNISD